MKKYLYYVSPFIIVSVLMLLCEAFYKYLHMSPAIIGVLLCVCSVVIANLSSTKHIFDYIITILMPLSLFIFMFFVGFFDKGETYSQFDFRVAFKTAFQEYALVLYAVLAVTAFISSFKTFRLKRILNKK